MSCALYGICLNVLDICQLSPEVGPCRGEYPHWFFNTASSQRELFLHGSCQGNQNQFDTIYECIDHCDNSYVIYVRLIS